MLNLTYTLILWSIFMGGYNIRVKGYKLDFVQKPFVTSFFYIIAFSTSLYLLNINLSLTNYITFEFIPVIFFSILFATLLYNFVRNNYSIPKEIIERHPSIQAFLLDKGFAFSKAIEVAFQQLIILALILNLKDLFDIHLFLPLFSLTFAIIHIPILAIIGRKVGYLVILVSLFGGLLFPINILFFEKGFIINYLIHWFVYLLIGITPYILVRKQT